MLELSAARTVKIVVPGCTSCCRLVGALSQRGADFEGGAVELSAARSRPRLVRASSRCCGAFGYVPGGGHRAGVRYLLGTVGFAATWWGFVAGGRDWRGRWALRRQAASYRRGSGLAAPGGFVPPSAGS
ncbi:hypothetical protein, partial [Paractinoplanes abujensis]|uniref:hypothetical protein n=1 Tax=Paractinoplanes abujensis TaxID=882441 RepID=UPI0019435015